MKRFWMLSSSMVLALIVAVTAVFAAQPTAESVIPGNARVRVAHASPDAPNVDVWVDGSVAFSDIAFTEITSYASLPAGSYLVQVEPAGAGGGGPFVISATLNLAADTDYTVAATDVLTNITPLVMVDNNSIPNPGQAHARFVHASPDAPAVDITLTDGTVLFGNYEFGEFSGYLPVAAGTYDLEVRLAGTSTVVLSLPGIPLENQKVYTVFAMGLAGGTPALTAVLAEDAGLTSVRVAHLSPDAPNVDVWVDGALSFTDVAFGEITSYASLPAGSYLVQVEPAGAGGSGPFVISATLTLESDNDYTVAAINSLAQIEPLVLLDDNTIPAVGDSHVRFVHASPDAPAVDITLADGTVLFGNYEFGEFSPYLPVAATTYHLQVRLAGTSTIVLDLPGVIVENQTVYTVWASGYAAGSPALAPIITVDAGLSRLRVAHLSPDAPNVDILVDGQEVVSDLPFEGVTGYLSLPAGDYYVEVWPAGIRSGGAVLSASLTLAPHTDYTAAAIDELANISLLILQDNNGTPAAGNAHVRFVHASPDAPAVDITLTDGTVLFGDVAFGEFSGYLPVAAGSYDLQVRLAGTSTVVLELPGIVLNNQDVYTVYATGFAGGEPALDALISVDLDTLHIFLPFVAVP